MAGRSAIRYEISMEEPSSHYFQVRLEAHGLDRRDSVRLVMPVWTPGSYLVREFSRNVLDVSVTNGLGSPLPVEKDSKNSWTVELGGSSEITVEYRVYAHVHSTQSSYLDSLHAVINGASVFLFVEGLEDRQVTLLVKAYPAWKRVSTALEPLPGRGETQYAAQNYDELVDSPAEVGNQRVASFEACGAEHEVAIFSPLPIGTEREEALVSDLRKIVEASVPIFGTLPYSRYVFLINFGESATGGTEHLNSSLCIVSYLALDTPQEYKRMLGIFSHEYFHLWNIKRMRPAGLGPFNYSSETYTKSLWIAEGVTSYYDDLILRRAVIFSVPEYLAALCENINVLKGLPSTTRRSAEESSFDSWIASYRPDENTPNVSPSYYIQGAAIGLILDLQIRHENSSSRSLDDVMRKVYQDTYVTQNRGYSEAEFERACEALAPEGAREIFEKHVRGREVIDFNRYLGLAGLTLRPRVTTSVPEGFLGVKLSGGSDKLVVASRLLGSAAEACDLAAGDEILAVDGLRVDAQRLAFSIAVKKPGSRVEILTARESVIREVTATLKERPTTEYLIQKKETASSEEKSLFRAWMGSDWQEPIQYVDYRSAPRAWRPLDYI